MDKTPVIFFALIILLITTDGLSKTIELKDGKKVIGDIVNDTDESIVVSKRGGEFIYSIPRRDIKLIRESTTDELGAERIQPAIAPTKGNVKEIEGSLEKRKEYRLEQYEKEVLLAKEARGRIKIKFSENRFGIVDALINGKVKASLIVDTGASMVVISEDIANKLGIDLKSVKSEIPVILADGSVTSATPVTLDSVKVGSSEVKNVSAAVSKTPPGQGVDGLLGMTFLRFFHVKMDAKENYVVLEKY